MARKKSPFSSQEAIEQGNRIKKLRVKTHLSRTAFSKKHGLSKGSLQNWEDGRYGLSEPAVKLLVAAFSAENIYCTEEYLIYGNLSTAHSDESGASALLLNPSSSKSRAPLEQAKEHAKQREINMKLMGSIAAGMSAQVAKLLSSCSILHSTEYDIQLNLYNDEGNTPLHEAVKAGHLNIVMMLVDKGAEVNSKNRFHQRPLHLAVRRGFVEIINYLVSSDANLNAEDRMGDTALAWSCRFGQSEIADQLIKFGATVNTRNAEGYTPLHWAAFSGTKDAVLVLLEKGAEAACKNTNKETPLQCAAKNGFIEVVQLLESAF